MNYTLSLRGLLLLLFLFLTLHSPYAALASEITGSLSSAGVQSSQNNSGTLTGNVVSPVSSGGGSSSGGGDGGGSIVIDNTYYNSQLNLQNPNTNSGQVLGASTYSPPKLNTYRYSGGNIAYTGNNNRKLAFGVDDLAQATTTEVSPGNTNTIETVKTVEVTNTTTNDNGFQSLSIGAWLLLISLILLAILAYYYLREEKNSY